MKKANFNSITSLPELDKELLSSRLIESLKDTKGVGAISGNRNSKDFFGKIDSDVKDSLFGNLIALLYSDV